MGEVYKARDTRLVVARIRQAGDPLRIGLFGSHACGQAWPATDLALQIGVDR